VASFTEISSFSKFYIQKVLEYSVEKISTVKFDVGPSSGILVDTDVKSGDD
jgi:hypothetical protein